MRTTALLLLAVLVFSCSSESGPPPEPAPTPEPVAGDVGTLPQSGSLDGQKLVEEKSGPWIVRRTAADPRNDVRGFEADGGAAGEPPPASAGAVPATAAPSGPALSKSAGGGRGGARAGDLAFGGDEGAASDPGAAPSEDAKELERPEAQGGAPLRAGRTDDNEDYAAFLEFLAKWGDRKDTAGQYDMLDVRDRRYVRVANREGKPVPGALVRIVDENSDRIVFTGTTYGDGRVPFYPKVALAGGTTAPVAAGTPGLLVEVAAGEARERTRWDLGGEELTVTVDVAKPVADPIRLDVLFLIDTTGSMGDEIRRIKESLLSVTQKLRALDREFDLRYAAVLYRDLGDAYVTMAHPFTSDIRAFDEALASVEANGGGDTPESLNQGLAEAVGRADWRPDAAKVMFLVADAPPHMDYQGDVRYGETVQAAVAKGIRIHSVAASGLDPLGTLVFRQIAQYTRGKFLFIQYGTIEVTAASHGVAGPVKSNNLDDILYEEIRDEIARWGR